MGHFQQFSTGIDVIPLLAQLHMHPELWDANTMRTEQVSSPHHGVPDIWVRTRPAADFKLGDGAFMPVFYPAWQALPALRDIVFPLAARFKASIIGNILITRIPAGARVRGHVDDGWSPEYFNCKTYVVLQGDAKCVNWCEDDRVVMQTGEGWLFKNTIKHGVQHDGAQDRLSLICTFRCDP